MTAALILVGEGWGRGEGGELGEEGEMFRSTPTHAWDSTLSSLFVLTDAKGMPLLPQHFLLTLELTLSLDPIELVVFFFTYKSYLPRAPTWQTLSLSFPSP